MSNIKTENPASQILPISVGAVSETGHREENQDSMTGFSSPVGAVYLIADGMGGHRGGKEASRIVAEAFTRHLLAVPESSPPRDALTLAVRLANLEILEKSKSGNPDFAGMGSTVVIALIRQTPSGLELMTAHIGDSRVYLQRDGQLSLLTKDHTQVQWLIDSQSIDEATARAHPDASVLTRALGHTTDLQVDISEPIPLAEGDAVLLCSDGLSGFASSEDIRNTVRGNPDPTNCANELVKLALACGSNDNITVQFLRIGNALPALEKPKRKTLPDAPSLSPVSVGEAAQIRTSTEKKRGRFFLLAIAVCVVLVGIVAAWYYVNQKAKPDPVLQNVRGSLDKLKAATNKFHERVEQDLDAVNRESATLKQPSAKVRQEFEDLKTKFGQLEGVSRKLQSKASAPLEYGSELDDASKLYGPARQKKIDELSRKIAEDQQKVDELSTKPETKLKGLEGIETLPALEARKAKAEKDAGLKDLRQHNPSGSPPVGQPHGNRSEGRS